MRIYKFEGLDVSRHGLRVCDQVQGTSAEDVCYRLCQIGIMPIDITEVVRQRKTILQKLKILLKIWIFS